MDETSNSTELRCPCGFWGSPQTLGLCSVCFFKAQQNQSSSQEGFLNSDAGKSSVRSYNHIEQGTQSKEITMDSRHFPTRSTTDNLPSSLSSPPGDRAALSAPATMNEAGTSTPTTTSCSSTNVGAVPAVSSHLSCMKSPEAKVSNSSSDAMKPVVNSNSTCLAVKPLVDQNIDEQKQIQKFPITPCPSDTDTCSSASSDLSYDPKRDPALLCPSSTSVDSCPSSIISATSLPNSAAVSSTDILSSELIPPTSSGAGGDNALPRNSSNIATQQHIFSAESSASTMQPSKSNTSAANIHYSSNISTKNKSSSLNTSSTIGPDSSNKIVTGNVSDSVSKQIAESVMKSEHPMARTESNPQLLPSIVSPAERGTKRSFDEMQTSSATSSPAASPQKNKKRCFICSCKLALAQRTIGKCRCDLVFCAIHRLPELHDCDFNHKEDGRREAREKMVKPTRHLGPSYRRDEKS